MNRLMWARDFDISSRVERLYPAYFMGGRFPGYERGCIDWGQNLARLVWVAGRHPCLYSRGSAFRADDWDAFSVRVVFARRLERVADDDLLRLHAAPWHRLDPSMHTDPRWRDEEGRDDVGWQVKVSRNSPFWFADDTLVERLSSPRMRKHDLLRSAIWRSLSTLEMDPRIRRPGWVYASRPIDFELLRDLSSLAAEAGDSLSLENFPHLTQFGIFPRMEWMASVPIRKGEVWPAKGALEVAQYHFDFRTLAQKQGLVSTTRHLHDYHTYLLAVEQLLCHALPLRGLANLVLVSLTFQTTCLQCRLRIQ